MDRLMDIPTSAERKRVVVVGGGFAGLNFCKRLKDERFQIVLLDKTNHHNFQPLLYQVATAGVEPSSISFPFRSLFAGRKNFHIRMCEVWETDAEAQEVKTSIGRLHYDYLVIATGCDTNYFGNKALEENTMALKTTAEALYNRNHILESFERAVDTDDMQEREKLLTFVVVGGGATGVELAGALAEMRRFVLRKDYPDLDVDKMRIILVDGKDRLLYSFKPKSSREAEEYLRYRGVELKQKTRVLGYENEVLRLSNEEIPTANVFWTAGVIANSMGGFSSDMYGHGNRLIVDEFNRVGGYKNVFALGDTALMKQKDWPDGHPQVAQPAMQQADNCADNILAMENGEALKPFKYHDRGSMATIGRNHAVVETKGLVFGGFLGWLVWLVIHLMNIVGFKNRLLIFIDWVWSYFTHNSNLRIVVRPLIKGDRLYRLMKAQEQIREQKHKKTDNS
ncbi:NAD(P)/FAD-dependent oxidoreductase [uncultured Parasutterella sp.]|uniref:NAD(P)/FAD-dependent oxidoreductase n=1 Tax=uncultured Parasutterella sp. TaxID=1263098 RepID=UPI002594F155|nr:NAD(P)/FAD-dependent oxidoreductase [uncultured Parasutterella sp.]